MRKDNKRLVMYLGFLFLAVIVSYKIPHNSYTIASFILRPIHGKTWAVYPSGLIPVILFVISIRGIWRLERYKNRSKIASFLLVVVILMPIMKWTLDVTRTNYYWLKKEGLKAVDIQESNISIGSDDNKRTINISLELIDYSRSNNEFKIRVYLPKSLSDYVGSNVFETKEVYTTHGNREIITVKESMLINVEENDTLEDVFDYHWYNETVKYELYNDQEVVRIIDHGL